MKAGRPRNEVKMKSCTRSMSKQEKKDLRTLADDFHLLDMKDVQEIIDNCKSYAEGQRAIMRVYEAVYLK